MIKLGSTDMAKAYVGSTEVSKVYLGSDLVYENAPMIPDEYKRVEYIYTTGSSYIDTNYTPNQDSSIELKARIISLSGSFIGLFGTETPRFSLYINNTTTSSPKARFDYNSTMKTYATSITKNTDYVFKIDKNEFFINGQKFDEAQYESFTAARSLYLFTIHNSSGVYGTYGKNIYFQRCRIWNNGNIAQDWYPTRRVSDNTFGLYDVVNKVFKGSYTSTKFSGGTDV